MLNTVNDQILKDQNHNYICQNPNKRDGNLVFKPNPVYVKAHFQLGLLVVTLNAIWKSNSCLISKRLETKRR